MTINYFTFDQRHIYTFMSGFVCKLFFVGIRSCIYAFLALFLPAYSNLASSQDFYVKDVIKEIRHAIDRPLPTFSEVLGQDIEFTPAPIVAIGFLENINQNDNKDWGKAIGWYLMEAANGITTDIAVLPSFQYLSDGLNNNQNQSENRIEFAQLAAKRTGAKYTITGRIYADTDNFRIQIEVTDISTGSRIANIKETNTMASLRVALANIATRSLQTIIDSEKPTAIATGLNLEMPADGEIEMLAEAFGITSDVDDTKKADIYEDLWIRYPDFLTTGTVFLSALDTIYDNKRLRKYLPLIISRDKTTPTLKAYSYMLASRVGLKGVNYSAIEQLKKILVSNPNNLLSWIALDHALTDEEVMYHRDDDGVIHIISSAIDHDMGRAQSILVTMEMLKRWPDYYRAWWSLGYTLKDYAGLVKGTNYWSQIPDNVKLRYRKIVKVADNCMFQALKRHPAQGVMYINMISLDVAFGRDWMSSFRRAVELAPNNRYTYETAFNYAQPQWGGTEDNQREIYRLARDNNPGDEWPGKLRDIWAPEIKPILDIESPWFICSLLFILIILIFASKKMYSNRMKR